MRLIQRSAWKGYSANFAYPEFSEVHQESSEYHVGIEGRSMRSVSTILEREGVPTPKGAKHWDRSFFRKCIEDDVYKPHTFEEVQEVVSEEVSARLEPRRQYGVWWFNRR